MAMLIEVVGRGGSYSFVLKLTKGISTLSRLIPFKTTLRVWKEEVYFSTPAELRLGRRCFRVRLGEVYYWPPERSICLFYGSSEAYTPVWYLGEFIGPVNYVAMARDGDEALVAGHEVDPGLKQVVNVLEGMGYYVGTPLLGDGRAVAASKYVGGCRVALLVFCEDYGYHVEGEALYKHTHTYTGMKVMHELKEFVRRYRYLRFDVNEDGYAVLTAGVENLGELSKAVGELEDAYPGVVKKLFT